VSNGRASYIEQYRARHATDVLSPERVGRARWIALVAAFVPMGAAAGLPFTALLLGVSSYVASSTTVIVGAVVLLGALCLAGYGLARTAIAYGGVSSHQHIRRALPWVASIVVIGFGLAEMLSGSKAPDPVIGLWFAAIGWVIASFPLAGGVWGWGRRAVWAAAPIVTAITLVFVGTSGFFDQRFSRSVDGLDAYAQRLESGEQFVAGTRAGGFRVEQYYDGARQCETEFLIDAFHEDDRRWILRCPDGPPDAGVTHLAGDWYEVDRSGAP
jgi:hypothetical protein